VTASKLGDGRSSTLLTNAAQKTKQKKTMKNILLIHGAWGGAWEFQEFIETLGKRGHRAHAIDLPGHGKSTVPTSKVTMEAYVERVIEVAHTIEGPIVLVGHSLAGAIISQVAERIPEKIERLVYVAASLPRNGETALGLMQSDEAGELLPNIVFSDDQSFATLEPEAVRNLLLHDVKEPERAAKLVSKFDVNQATEPFMFPVKLSNEAFGSVAKSYVRASLDKVMSLSLQDRMISAWKVETIFTLESGHFPMMSIPDRFVEVLSEAVEGAVAHA
jgi:pimeloyl-ACP methyl ester carboxylesterase